MKSPSKKSNKPPTVKRGAKKRSKTHQLPLNNSPRKKLKLQPVQTNCGHCNKQLTQKDTHDNFTQTCTCCKNKVIVKPSCAKKLFYKHKVTGKTSKPPPTVSAIMFNRLKIGFYCKLCQHKCFYCNTTHTGTFLEC